MAQKETTQKKAVASLEEFSWDENPNKDFFNIGQDEGKAADATSKVVKNVKGNNIGWTFDEEGKVEDDEEFEGAIDQTSSDEKIDPVTGTKIKSDKPENKGKSKAEDNEQPEDEDADEKTEEDKVTEVEDQEQEPLSVEETTKLYTALAKDLKEQGIINVDLPDGDITPDTLFDITKKEIEQGLDEAVEALFEGIDEDGKEYINFLRLGGTTEDFLKTYGSKSPAFNKEETDDAKKEKQAIAVLKHYYKVYEGLDDEDIDDNIEMAKEGGKLFKFAEKKADYLKTKEEEAKTNLIESQKQRNKEIAASRTKLAEDVEGRIKNAKELGDLTITDKDKKELPTFLFKPTVKVGKDQFITGFQAALHNVLNDETKRDQMIILSKLLLNNFDLSDVKTKGATQTAKRVRSNLENQATGSKRPNGGAAPRLSKSLADFFVE